MDTEDTMSETPCPNCERLRAILIEHHIVPQTMKSQDLYELAQRQATLEELRADIVKHAADALEAYRVRDLAREASNRDLEAKRQAEAEVTKHAGDAREAYRQRDRIFEELKQVECLAANWQDTAEQEMRNTQYYRGLVVQIGLMLGIAARTADDGTVSEDILCAKVPELVRTALEDPQHFAFLQIDAAIAKLPKKLVVHVRYNQGEDHDGDPCVFFRVLLTDKAAKSIFDRSKPADAIASVVRHAIHPLVPEGLHAYFNFRSESEQAQMKEKEWE